MISVLQLGLVDYAAGLRIQRQLVELRQAGEIGDVLLLLEHTPVITLGRNAKATNILLPAEQLALRGVEVFECDRGGDVTFHGPGQLVGYPIFDLRSHELLPLDGDLRLRSFVGGGARATPARKTLGAVDYVRRLEEVLIRTCADFAIPAKRVAGLTGVWTDDVGPGLRPGLDGSETRPYTTSEAKIAALGVHISRFVASHGFALNVNTDLSYFNLIVPCGITAKPVTSMNKELGREVDLVAVAESVSRHFGVVFSSQMLWVETLDALLGNSIGVPMKAPEELREVREEDETFWA
jgi:lipoyl(octanoyl) transferase